MNANTAKMTPPGTTDRSVGVTKAPVVEETEARQAVSPHRLRYMLILGIVAVIIGFGLVYLLVA